MVNDNVEEHLAQGSESAADSSAPSENNANLDGYVPVSRLHESNAITRKKSYEKGYQRGLEEARGSYDSPPVQPIASAPSAPVQQTTSPQNFSRSEVQDLLKEEAQKIVHQQQMEIREKQLEEWGRAVESDFLSKSEKLKAENPDFDGKAIVNKAASLAPFAFAYSADLENSPEVWSHLIEENPIQLRTLEEMIRSKDQLTQQTALDEIKKVSNRLKQNRIAKDTQVPPTPINPIDNTHHGVGRSGNADMDYFRNLHSRRKR